MGILYKGYSVPAAPSRYVDMGMSFKTLTKSKQTFAPSTKLTRKARCKPGELRDYVLTLLTNKWQGTKEIAATAERAPEGVRSALEALTKLGLIESNGIKGMRQYRKLKEQKCKE